MDKIAPIFRPWLDNQKNLDYIKTRLGWVRISNLPYDEQIQFLQGPENMLCTLVGDFLDQADGGSAREAADNALEAMQPFLRQLPQALADYTRAALEVYARLDD